MNAYSFCVIERNSSQYEYPTQLYIVASSKAEAVNRMGVEHGMKVIELGDDYIWLETPDGVHVKYTVTPQTAGDTGMFDV